MTTITSGSPTTLSVPWPIQILIVLLIVIVYFRRMNTSWPILNKITRSKDSETLPATPILLSTTLGNADIFHGATTTTPQGYHVEYYVSGLSLFSHEETRGIYAVELPFMTGVHLLGIPRQNESTEPLSITKPASMEPVELEGNYNDIFSLYADRDQQIQSRFVLDPAAMIFTIDFCRRFNWEIVGDTLYFMNSGKLPSFEIVDKFVQEIRPAIEVSSDRQKHPYNMSYTQFSGRDLKCPICQKLLVAGAAWLACPDGHGCLVTGKQLLDMAHGEEPTPPSVDASTSHSTLTCPYCSNPMTAQNYAFTNVRIDVCSKCMFRWLDAGEPAELFK